MINIPEGFVNEIIDYLLSRPMSEVEVAVGNLRYFVQESKKVPIAESPVQE